MEEKTWQFIRDREYPLFVRYLKTKGFDPTTARGVVVAIFHTDRCYLLKGEDILNTYLDMEGIDPAGLLQKIQRWLSA